jgi:4-amino-4-deoxy-L-arabinose transferase-like glycosyltransferase
VLVAPRLRHFAPLPAWLCRLLAAALVLGAAGLHLAYLLRCPLDLAPDEAHYWDWSRHLDWSYYSKGPLVAYLIRASCEVFGAWSQQHTGSLAFAIRLPAVLCGSLLLLSLYVLTVQVYRRETLALGLVGLALTLPLISVGSLLMTIDAPYTCCWGWALVLGYQAVFRGSRWAWPALGLMVGLGVLAKYTMVLWVFSLELFLLATPAYRSLLRQRGVWLMGAVACVCCIPILVWNAQHDWVTVRHVLGLSGVARNPAEPRIHWLAPLSYAGEQCALLLGYWFLAWSAAMVAHHPGRESDPAVRYLWWLSAPTFLTFLAFSPRTGGGEMNWPVTAYLSGLVLAAAWLSRQLASPHRGYRLATAVGLAAACVVGLALTTFMHGTQRLYPLLSRLVGPPQGEFDFPLRRVDPTCRLRGWRGTLAAEVDRWRAVLRVIDGCEPVLAGVSWTTPGELGVYCAGHPQAYSVGPALHERHSQYDLWPNPIADGERFRGRTFLIIGGVTGELREAFDEVWPAHLVVHRVRGQPVTGWVLTVCRGFRGRFPTADRTRLSY